MKRERLLLALAFKSSEEVITKRLYLIFENGLEKEEAPGEFPSTRQALQPFVQYLRK